LTITGVTPDETTIRDFVQRCPPLTAILLALCTAQCERCIADTPSPSSQNSIAFAFFSRPSFWSDYE
jgi:hypothetical protein